MPLDTQFLPELERGVEEIRFSSIEGAYRRVQEFSDLGGGTLKELFPQYLESSDENYILDSSFVDPVNTLKLVRRSLKRNLRGLDDDEMYRILRVTLGEIKSLENLAETGRLITHPSTFRKIQTTGDFLEERVKNLKDLFFDRYGSSCGDFLETIEGVYGFYNTLESKVLENSNAQDIDYNKIEKVSQEILGKRELIFQSSYGNHFQRKRKISEENMSLYLLAHQTRGTILTSNNGFLFLGIRFKENSNSPTICRYVKTSHASSVKETFGRFQLN